MVTAQEKSPERGFRPAGSYALSDIETISTTSGNLMLKVPLAGLPAGRGGLSASLNLLYNSKLYDAFPMGIFVNQSYYDVTRLKNSQAGGWRYGFKYELYGEGRYPGTDESGELNACSIFSGYIARLSLITPDGGKHVLRLAGYTDGDGFQNIWRDGKPACPGGPQVETTLSYYTTDGTFLRLDVEHDGDANASNNPWTLFLPDGGRVTGGGASQRIYDRNNNYIEIVNGSYNGHSATYLNDQVGRSIIIEYESATNQDSIHVRGVANELLTSTVAWTNIQVRKSYYSEAGPNVNYSHVWRSVAQINLPSQAGSLSYSFGYNANGSNPTVGWGEISSITLPSGAKSTYTYLQDNQNGADYNLTLQDRPTQKQLVYRPEHDVSGVSNTPCNTGTETCITDTWTYGMTYAPFPSQYIAISSTITGPDGGVTTEHFNKGENGAVDASESGLVYKSVAPDGTVSERYWQNNIPNGTPLFNETFFVKFEFTSITNTVGTLTQTAIKEHSYDKNGNVTRVAVFDWVPYASVPRNGQGRPYAPPAGVLPKAVTVNTYYNPTPDASDYTTYDPDAFQIATSPRLHRLVESSEVQTSAGTALSRTEMFYDYTATAGVVAYPIGNVTQQKSWDSTKGAIYSSVSSGNSISVSSQYDSFGNPTLVTDARGTQTQSVYGLVNGFTGLYPTEIRAAFGTSLQRYTTLQYEYYTGVVTRATDVDNNVATATTYDVFGRPTLVKAAVDKTEETRTATAYSDTNRRVIVRSDLTALGDGKIVSIKHYDQLGRVRLARQLENAATEIETDETKGIKVQSRYLISGSHTYQVTSNPYRANYSYSAGSEVTMGWSRSKSDLSGRLVEAQTFGGAALPAPWGGNSTSTGTVTTSYDANFTTVTDQIGKVRRSMINGLGQLARVDEPDTNGSLGTTTSPTQPTSYTYNELSNLTQVVQGSQTRTFIYSSLSRLISATNPEACNQVGSQCTPVPVTYQYDNNGNLTQKTDARSIVTTYVYDALNRNTSVDYTDATPDTFRQYDLAINGKGRLNQVWQSGSTTSATYIDSYDALGRPLIQRQKFETGGVWSSSYQVFREYNRAGGVTLQRYPSGRTVIYDHDTAGRTSSFSGNLGDNFQRTYATGILYSSLGSMAKEQFGTDTPLYNKSFYNSRGQRSEIRVGTYHATDQSWWNRGAIINHYSDNCWGMCSGAAMTDNNGNLKKQDVYVPHNDQISSYTNWWQGYDYDHLNRLQRVHEHTGNPSLDVQQEYLDYDRWGNRRIDPNPAKTYGGVNNLGSEVDTGTNRLYSPGDLALPDASRRMRYDKAGNLIKDTYTGAGDRTYDAENRMTQAWGGNNQQQFYTYNADGQRVRRKVDGLETWQIYGMDGELVAEYPANGALTSPRKEYGYRNGQLLITTEASTGNVIWTNAVGVGVSGNSLTKTAAEAWGNAGAASTQALVSGDGYVEFTANETNTNRMCGLSNGDSNQNYTDIDFAFYPANGALNIYEGGVHRGAFGPYATGDLLRVAVEGGVVKYRKNGTLLYTSTVNETYPLLVDTALHSNGATLINVVISGNLTTDIKWLVADHLGTPRMIFDRTGSLAKVKRHDYLPFGEELVATQGVRSTALGYTGDTVRQKFTQYERDGETQLDYAQARYYSSQQGRFTSVDPLPSSANSVDPQTFNRYTYAMNAPANYTDPSGMLSMNMTSAMGQFARNFDPNGSGGWGGAFTSGGTEKTPALPQSYAAPAFTIGPDGSAVPYDSPQNTYGPLGGGQSSPAVPCAGVTHAQLDYSSEHFTERHILETNPAYANRSKYRFFGGIGSRLWSERDPEKRLEIARQAVIGLNKITFEMGGRYQARPSANVAIVFGFPKYSDVSMDVTWFIGDIGTGQPHAGHLTNVNTLIIANDCKTVITSYPGLPNGAYTYRGTAPFYKRLE